MTTPLLSESDLRTLGERVRADLLDNFARSAITNRTGALRGAIEGATIAVDAAGDALTATITLGNVRRPPRPGESNPPTTWAYGPPTFQWAAGRPSLAGRSVAAVTGRSNMIFGRSSQAGGVQVMVLSDGQTDEIKQAVSELVAESIGRILRR